MAQNRRRTFANAISRHRHFTFSMNFQNQKANDLNERMEFLKSDYAAFTKEHQQFVAELPDNQFIGQDKYFSNMTGVYQDTILAYRKQINVVETRELLQRAENNTKENERVECVNNSIYMQANTTDRTNRANKKSIVDEKVKERRNAAKFKRERELDSNAEKHDDVKRVRSIVIPRRKFSLANNDLRHQLNSSVQLVAVSTKACHFCKGEHSVYNCTQLRNLAIETRVKAVQRANLCQNCLRPINEQKGHYCQSKHCMRCGNTEFHNSMLCPNSFRRY